MKKYGKMLTILSALLLIPFTGCSGSNKDITDTAANDNTYNIVTSFYPMHILAMNLVDNIDGVEEKSMADPNLGCIHDHTFTADDLRKIENADVYIENGLDLEGFNDKIIEAYPEIKIIEASKNVTDYIIDGNEINGHVWTSLDDYIKQIEYVSSMLQEYNPENKEKYAANEKIYIDKLTDMKEEYSSVLENVKGKKALVLDETLLSFCTFTGIDEIEVIADHDQGSFSAEQLKTVLKQMESENINSIFITKDGDTKNASAIAAETGAKIYELNSCMTGDVDKDAYINYMKENFELISDMQ